MIVIHMGRIQKAAGIFIAIAVMIFSLSLKSNKIEPVLSYNSFIFININLMGTSYETNDFSERHVTGSGAVIKSDRDETLILTAAHVCFPSNDAIESSNFSLMKFITVRDWSGNEHYATVYAVDNNNDMCILRTGRTDIPSLKISRIPPRVGERVYNLASPFGIFGNKFVLTFEGFYSGQILSENQQIYTIPAAPGSSGSPILNENGHLIGMIHSATSAIENIAIGPRTDIMVDFISRNN